MARKNRGIDPRTDKSDPPADTGDREIILEARDRMRRGLGYEDEFRNLFVIDTKFAYGDSDNGWQWPDDMKKERDNNDRPALTINKTQNHVFAVSNQTRKNKPSAKVSPTAGEASYKAAQIWEGIIRQIESRSNATAIYVDAQESQLQGGVGYWRIITDFADDESFDQEISIEPVQDAMSVVLDCDIKHRDGSDAMWGFIYENKNRKEFERLHPTIELPPVGSKALDETDGWVSADDVRIAEYYRINITDETLVWMKDEKGVQSTFKLEDVDAGPARDEAKKYLEQPSTYPGEIRSRKIKRRQLQWFKIMGEKIVDRRDLKGSYIPIVRLPGRERRIDSKLYRAGMVRALKDAQRMYNYNTSAEVEFGALQTKTPWIVALESIEGNQGAWEQANTKNFPYLGFKSVTADGRQLPPPQRSDPPAAATAFLEGMRIAAAEMEMASGQYQPQQHQQMLERTPQAINARQIIGDTATYDFVDNLAMAVRYTAKIIIDLAPHIYDTERVIKILGKDGTVSEVMVAPDLPQAASDAQEEDEIKVMFNPKVGRYEVEPDVGPAYGTMRDEAWNAFSQIISASPEMMNLIGDLAFREANFPSADKIAERIKRHIAKTAPWLLDESAEGPLVMQMKAQIEDMTKQLAEALEKLAEERLKSRQKDGRDQTEVYRATTDRVHQLANSVRDMKESGGTDDDRALKALLLQSIAEAMGFDLQDVVEATKPALDRREAMGAADPT